MWIFTRWGMWDLLRANVNMCLYANEIMSRLHNLVNFQSLSHAIHSHMNQIVMAATNLLLAPAGTTSNLDVSPL